MNSREEVRVFYLKRIRTRNGCHYILSETYSDRGILKSRDIMELGPDPSVHIRYPGGNRFYLSPVIEETLNRKGVDYTVDDLEFVFKSFLAPELQNIIERYRSVRKPCDLDALAPEHREVHLFDARRLYYLRFARMDSGELAVRRWKFLDVFLCKSRDEIESMIADMEHSLPPSEYAVYVYAALGVPLLFPRYLRDHPAALDPAMVDAHVLDALCRIDRDEKFFLGVERDSKGSLHAYLRKYAWFYFDHSFRMDMWDEGIGFARENGRRPVQRSDPPLEEAYRAFAITAGQFARMSRKDLIRIYRRKAKTMHPDKGGDHEDFVRLSEAYERLMSLKK